MDLLRSVDEFAKDNGYVFTVRSADDKCAWCVALTPRLRDQVGNLGNGLDVVERIGVLDLNASPFFLGLTKCG
jgi:hypothetical protein